MFDVERGLCREGLVERLSQAVCSRARGRSRGGNKSSTPETIHQERKKERKKKEAAQGGGADDATTIATIHNRAQLYGKCTD